MSKADQDIKIPSLPPISHSGVGLRTALFDELNLIRQGQSSPMRAKVVAQLAHRIIEAARIELQIKGQLPSRKGRSLVLGSR